MSNDSLPPFLRGLGTTVVLVGAVIAFVVARQHVETQKLERARAHPAAPQGSNADLRSLSAEVQELRSEIEHENVVEEVIESRWFEWMGFIGTALIASSFFVEAYVRRKNLRIGAPSSSRERVG